MRERVGGVREIVGIKEKEKWPDEAQKSFSIDSPRRNKGSLKFKKPTASPETGKWIRL